MDARIILAVLILSGCLGTGHAPTPPEPEPAEGSGPLLPDLHSGDLFRYASSEGVLVVSVRGVEERRNPGSEPVQAAILDMAYRSPAATVNATVRYQEAIDLRSGTIVHQASGCDAMVSEDEGRYRCYLDNRSLILFSGQGLPGLFGTGPVHATGSPSYAYDLPRPAAIHSVTARASPINATCWQVNLSTDLPRATSRTSPWTVSQDAADICGNVPLPVRFTSSTPLHGAYRPSGASGSLSYELVEWTPGDGAALVWGPFQTPPAPSPILPLRPVEHEPFYTPAAPRMPLTVREAYEKAVEADQPFAGLMEQADAQLRLGLVRWAGMAWAGNGGPGPEVRAVEQVDYEAILVGEAGGEARLVVVTKQLHWAADQPLPPTYVVSPSQAHDPAKYGTAGPGQQMASLDDAREHLEAWSRRPAQELVQFTTQTVVPEQVHWQDVSPRSGPGADLLWAIANPPAASGITLEVVAYAVYDGASGTAEMLPIFHEDAADVLGGAILPRNPVAPSALELLQ